MEKQTDILIIGGGPAGIVSAITAKKYYPNKNILLMKNIEKSCIPCGIPYMFSSLKDPDENKLGNAVLENNCIDVIAEETIKIDRENKTITTKNDHQYRYEKLILATGSSPIKPKISGIEKKGVYPVYKEMDYLKNFVEAAKKSKSVLIIGGGFIGVEFADEISKIKDIKVYLVEIFPHILENSFDTEFSELAKEKLTAQGVEVITNVKAEEILGDEKVEAVSLSNGRELKVDCVVLGMGARPNTQLASDSNLDLDRGKGIWTDEYMRTIDSNIFAVGDCASKRDFFTRRYTPVMLASTAAAEARIAGANLYELKVLRENKGTIAIYSTYVNGLVLGSVGLTENCAKKEGFEIVTGEAQGVDKHPETLPGACPIKLKLIFSRQCGVILGGQISGGIAWAELINFIGVAIQKRMSFSELEGLQVATHPYLTSSPIMYPIMLATQDAAMKM